MPRFPVPGREARRILVFGISGAGKSTLARRLGTAADLPVVDVDSLMWEPGWVEVERSLRVRRMTEVAARDAWVVDACYGWMPQVLFPRLDLILGLDYAWLTVRRRLYTRTVMANIDRREMCNGNRETWKSLTTDRSLLNWQKDGYRPHQEKMRAWSRGEATHEVPPPPTLLLTSPAQARRYLRFVAERNDRA